MSTIYVYISGCGDNLKQLLDRASLGDNPDEIRRLSQDIEAANEVWKKWCLAQGGDVIFSAGDSFKLRVGADHLQDVPELRMQYEQLTGVSTSIGVGTKVSEADRALEAAKKSGGDMVRLYGPDVEEGNEESGDSLQKADVETLPPTKGGPQPAQLEEPETPETPIGPNQTPAPDVHEVLGNVASAQGRVDDSQRQVGADQENAGEGAKDLKGQVLQVLQVIKQKAPELEGLQQQDPELYQGITGLIQSMVAMARKAFAPEEEPVQKSEPPLLHGTVEGFMGGLKALPKEGPSRGKFITSHMNHAPFMSALQAHPQGKAVHAMLTQHLNSRANAGMVPGQARVMAKGDIVPFKAPAPTGKKFRAKAEVVPIPTDANSVTEEDPAKWFDPQAKNRAAAGAVPHFDEPRLAVPAGPGGKNIYNYSHFLPEADQASGHSLVVRHSRGEHDDGMDAFIVNGDGRKIRSKFAYPTSFTRKPNYVTDLHDEALQDAIENHSNWIKYSDPVHKAELLPGGKGDGKPDSDFDAEALAHGVKTEMEEHGLDEARASEVAKDHLTEDPNYYAMDKAALEAGKTGRHQVKYPVGSQKDSSPNGTRDAGKIKVQTAEGKTKWRSVRANMISAADGSPTSSRNPGAK